jgi:RNA polymerase primary sigma factor
MPTAGQLRRFDRQDRANLRRLFTEHFEYVDHELFHKPNAEEAIYGGKAVLDEQANCFVQDLSADLHLGPVDEQTTLSTAREIELFQKFNYARMRMAKLLEQAARRRLRHEELRELLAWDHRAAIQRDAIAQANVPLVLAMAKRTRLNGLDPNELISEGNFALLRSIEKFDCSRGFKFSTYACRAILKSFSRVAMRVSKYRGRFPTEFDPELEKSDFVERKRDGIEAECVDEIRDIIDHNRADLNDIERTVIRERFALNAVNQSCKGKTLEQVGELIGVTKERVRQIQNKALRKIRYILEDNFLAASRE